VGLSVMKAVTLIPTYYHFWNKPQVIFALQALFALQIGRSSFPEPKAWQIAARAVRAAQPQSVNPDSGMQQLKRIDLYSNATVGLSTKNGS